MARHVDTCPFCGGPDYVPHDYGACARSRVAALETEVERLRGEKEELRRRFYLGDPEPVMRQWQDGNAALRATLAMQEAAFRELLDAPIWSHERWDPKGTCGTNCQTCIVQREARDRAKKTLAGDPSDALTQWSALVRAAVALYDLECPADERTHCACTAHVETGMALALPANAALRDSLAHPKRHFD